MTDHAVELKFSDMLTQLNHWGQIMPSIKVWLHLESYKVRPHGHTKKPYLLRPGKRLAQLVGSFSSNFGLGSLDQKMFLKNGYQKKHYCYGLVVDGCCFKFLL